MTTKTNLSRRALKLCSTLCVVLVLASSCSPKKTNALQPAVFAAGSGFGYTISLNEKVIIKQDVIPAVAGNAAFCDSLDAVKVSSLVVQKLSHKQAPTITQQDLATLKIKTKC